MGEETTSYQFYDARKSTWCRKVEYISLVNDGIITFGYTAIHVKFGCNIPFKNKKKLGTIVCIFLIGIRIILI